MKEKKEKDRKPRENVSLDSAETYDGPAQFKD